MSFFFLPTPGTFRSHLVQHIRNQSFKPRANKNKNRESGLPAMCSKQRVTVISLRPKRYETLIPRYKLPENPRPGKPHFVWNCCKSAYSYIPSAHSPLSTSSPLPVSLNEILKHINKGGASTSMNQDWRTSCCLV